jgi:tryptophan synthase alpha chain
VYYVSLKGVTGAGTLDTDAVAKPCCRAIRQHMGSTRWRVGFGIRDAATAQALGKVADAVVIGTKIIQVISICRAKGRSQCEELFARNSCCFR